MRLECHKCGHSWNYKGKGKYSFCPQCRKNNDFHKIRTGLVPTKKGTKVGTTVGTKIGNNLSVQQNIVNGSILDALEQAGIDPLENTKFVNDSILHILERYAVYNSIIFTIIIFFLFYPIFPLQHSVSYQ